MPWKPGGKVQRTIFCRKLYENLALALKVKKNMPMVFRFHGMKRNFVPMKSLTYAYENNFYAHPLVLLPTKMMKLGCTMSRKFQLFIPFNKNLLKSIHRLEAL